MKKQLLLAVLAASTVQAVPVDLGPSGVVSEWDGARVASVPSLGLAGTHLAGQNISLDLTFNQFVRAFSNTGTLTFQLYVYLDSHFVYQNVNDFPSDRMSAGQGYFTDQAGNAVGRPVPLDVYTDGFGSAGIDLRLGDFHTVGILASTDRPLDLYGYHLDLTLPNFPDSSITDSPNYAIVWAYGPHQRDFLFGIGPNIPADLVPDETNTIILLSCALLTLSVCRKIRI